MNEDFLNWKLDERRTQHLLRQLRLPGKGLVDFCSNDYLGIVTNRLLQDQVGLATGSTGSRLLTGNYELIESAERLIASFHQADAALIFNSGYDANLGLLSSLPQRGDTIIYDHLSHASLRDGIRLSFADAFSFQHNDMTDLIRQLKKAKGNVFVVAESVFSMDGDVCPLTELITICEEHGAHLIIDEAHATGVIGEKGEGLVQMLGLQNRVLARIHTFGKACGSHGAAALGSAKLKDYLVNFARPFVFSTALPAQTIAHITSSYDLFPVMNKERDTLRGLVDEFSQGCATYGIPCIPSKTPIQGVIIPGNEEVRRVAKNLEAGGLDLRPILYPTVPKGEERLRIVLHAFNTKMEVDLLLNCLKNSL